MERRNSFRVPCGVSVEVLLDGGSVQADLMNISQRGMFLRSNLLSPMDSLKMASAMASSSEIVIVLTLAGRGEELRAAGRVAWKSDMGVGVDFHQVSPGMVAYIDQLSRNSNDPADVLQQIAGRPQVRVISA